MFTWEEAGLLRSMLLVLKWTFIAALLGSGVYFRRPLLNGVTAVYHRIDARVHGRIVAGPASPSAR